MAKPDSERGQYGAWVREHRKRLAGNNIDGLSRLLEGEGIGAAPETIRGWEAGARPSDDASGGALDHPYDGTPSSGAACPKMRSMARTSFEVSVSVRVPVMEDEIFGADVVLVARQLAMTDDEGQDALMAALLGEHGGT